MDRSTSNFRRGDRNQEQSSEHNDFNQGQNFTNYPISRLQAFRMFKKPIQYNIQKVYQSKNCLQMIEDSLAQLKKCGYNFKTHYRPKGFKKDQGRSNMRRKVKARFHCQSCSHPFTSILGNFEVAFRIEGPTYNRKIGKNVSYNQIDQIDFSLRLYKMKCQRCQEDCDGAIYESQLEAVAKSFCVVLAQMLDAIPQPQHNDDRYKQNQDMHNHRAELCEACQKGVCFNMDRNAINANRIKEKTHNVDQSSEDENPPEPSKNIAYQPDKNQLHSSLLSQMKKPISATQKPSTTTQSPVITQITQSPISATKKPTDSSETLNLNVLKQKQLYDQAIEHYDNGEQKEAMEVFLKCQCELEHNYPSPSEQQAELISILKQKILLAMGKCSMELMDWPKARKYFAQVVKNNPKNFEAAFQKVMSMIELNQYAEAQKHLLFLIKIYPSKDYLSTIYNVIKHKKKPHSNSTADDPKQLLESTKSITGKVKVMPNLLNNDNQ